jgi:hypothetical protein
MHVSRAAHRRRTHLPLSYLLESGVKKKSAQTYVGATVGGAPWTRLDQHNGVLHGGVERLRPGRPWRVVAWVDGFPTWKHALKFERAWQSGFKAPCMRHAARFAPARGAVGKLQLLRTLLHTRTWRAHALRVRLVTYDAGPHAAARDARRVAALDGYAHVSRVPATRDDEN